MEQTQHAAEGKENTTSCNLLSPTTDQSLAFYLGLPSWNLPLLCSAQGELDPIQSIHEKHKNQKQNKFSQMLLRAHFTHPVPMYAHLWMHLFFLNTKHNSLAISHPPTTWHCPITHYFGDLTHLFHARRHAHTHGTRLPSLKNNIGNRWNVLIMPDCISVCFGFQELRGVSGE